MNPENSQTTGDIVALAGRYYRNTRYIMCALLVIGGIWFGYDGFIAWPEHNQKIADLKTRIEQGERSVDDGGLTDARTQLGQMDEEHGPTDILFQKLLMFALPPIGIALLGWALYNSRGEYRLSGNTLTAPGHPPLTMDQITQIDKQLWDRKGIAYLSYQASDGTQGKVKLDDFVYERSPTDAIFKRVESAVGEQLKPGRGKKARS